MRLQGCSYPNFVGTSQARYFSLESTPGVEGFQDILTLTLKTSVMLMRERPSIGVLVWQRKSGKTLKDRV